jgi:serine protease AprX
MRARAGLALAALGLGGLAAPVAAGAVTVVVSYDDASALRGLRVEAVHPHVRTAVVEVRSVAALSATPGIRGISPDLPLRPTSNGGQVSADGVFSWEQLGGQAGRPGAGAGVRVALVDTGVSDTVALSRASGRLVDAVDTSGTGTMTDGYGHGTFMAGVVAGGPVEGTGSRGLGVAPGATVVNVKVADATGTTSLSKVLAGLDWVVANAGSVDVMSFSFSRSRPGPGYGPDPLTDAVERVRAAGVLPVVSAGNTPGEVGDPGFDPRVLTVGAANLTASPAAVAGFSGSAVVAGVAKPDVVASGVGVLSVLPPDSAIAVGSPGARRTGLLWRGSGTSQATATTAGVAAMFLAAFPSATPRQVKASLRAAAAPISGDAGAGLVNVPHRLVGGTDGTSPNDGGGDGEGGFDANSWSANSWSANSWSANSWSANSWSANSWSANSWSGRWDE